MSEPCAFYRNQLGLATRYCFLRVQLRRGVLHCFVADIARGDNDERPQLPKLFCLILTYDILIKKFTSLLWGRKHLKAHITFFGEFFFDDFVAKINTLIADIDTRSSNKFLTCFCDLPQNEHFRISPESPNFATRRLSVVVSELGRNGPLTDAMKSHHR